ncbi:hypothetical protein BDZ94DRAFT_1254181 [Collybia nuda]|uniref:DUF6533 domain-containing protein n=1 Tax=Collybia nuda TaxID=64659 RepID=A0A9P6CGI2_9AGAR|nr:hypothetical protein BDZ94DRAFT_1254181 [Collybia nuda]
MATSQSLHELSTGIFNLTVTRYSSLASFALLIWDTLLTMDHQVSRVWLTRRSLGRTLFIINRYVPIVLTLINIIYQFSPSFTMTFCQAGFLVTGLGGVLNFGTIQAMLLVRTHALYNNKNLLIVLLLMWLSSTATMVAILMHISLKGFMTYAPPGSIPVPGCIPVCNDPSCGPLMKGFYIPFSALETVIFVLTIYKTFETCRLTGWRHSSSLSQVIHRDGIIYYIVIISITVFNMVVWWVSQASLGDLGQNLLLALQSTICSRLVLNIRESVDIKTSPNITGIYESYQRRHMSNEMEANP